jgi:hypothetical protein
MRCSIAIVGMILVPIWVSGALAQRGAGERPGIARQADKPKVQNVAGSLKEVKTGPCEHTTGRSPVGTHLILEGKETTFNLHLGPESEVKDVVERTKIGEPVEATAFRTGRLADEHYVAVTVKLGGEEIRLRDDSLRPRWAGDGRRGGGVGRRGGDGPMGPGSGQRLVSSRVLIASEQLDLTAEQVESIESILAEAEQRVREALAAEQLQSLESRPRGGQGRRRGLR